MDGVAGISGIYASNPRVPGQCPMLDGPRDERDESTISNATVDGESTKLKRKGPRCNSSDRISLGMIMMVANSRPK